MKELREIVIGDYTYTVQQLDAYHGLKLLHKLVAALSPALGKIAGAVAGFEGGIGDLDISVVAAAIGPALEAIFDRLTAEQFIEVTKELMQGCVVTGDGVENPDLGKPQVFNHHFTGRLPDVFKLLRFALEVNYGDFFGVLLDFAKRAQPKGKAKASPSLQS